MVIFPRTAQETDYFQEEGTSASSPFRRGSTILKKDPLAVPQRQSNFATKGSFLSSYVKKARTPLFISRCHSSPTHHHRCTLVQAAATAPPPRKPLHHRHRHAMPIISSPYRPQLRFSHHHSRLTVYLRTSWLPQQQHRHHCSNLRTPHLTIQAPVEGS